MKAPIVLPLVGVLLLTKYQVTAERSFFIGEVSPANHANEVKLDGEVNKYTLDSARTGYDPKLNALRNHTSEFYSKLLPSDFLGHEMTKKSLEELEGEDRDPWVKGNSPEMQPHIRTKRKIQIIPPFVDREPFEHIHRIHRDSEEKGLQGQEDRFNSFNTHIHNRKKRSPLSSLSNLRNYFQWRQENGYGRDQLSRWGRSVKGDITEVEGDVISTHKTPYNFAFDPTKGDMPTFQNTVMHFERQPRKTATLRRITKPDIRKFGEYDRSSVKRGVDMLGATKEMNHQNWIQLHTNVNSYIEKNSTEILSTDPEYLRKKKLFEVSAASENINRIKGRQDIGVQYHNGTLLKRSRKKRSWSNRSRGKLVQYQAWRTKNGYGKYHSRWG